ncbi:MAG: hypothetical protein HUJ78_06715, partial [Mogibacterium sp.]|nr:hypothetical protein [Mogibacterium sp.]
AFTSYSSYGFCIGSSMVTSPIYNQSGNLSMRDTRMRGIHAGIKGYIGKHLDYRLIFQYRKSWGTVFVPNIDIKRNTALLVEANYKPLKTDGLNIKAQIAFDRGSIVGNNTGFLIGVAYKGRLMF